MSPDQRRTLEAIAEISEGLHRLAIASGSDVLAHLIGQAMVEARTTLAKSDKPEAIQPAPDQAGEGRNPAMSKPAAKK